MLKSSNDLSDCSNGCCHFCLCYHWLSDLHLECHWRTVGFSTAFLCHGPPISYMAFVSSHLIFNVPLSKLYTTSLMSSLNSRAGWKFSNRSSEATTTNVNRDGTGPKSRVRYIYIFPLRLLSSLKPFYVDWRCKPSGVDQSTGQCHQVLSSRMVLDNQHGLQVFVHVESHEMVDIEDHKAANHLFADVQPDGTQSWNSSHVNNKSIVGSVVQ